jgi:hypothetical protein
MKDQIEMFELAHPWQPEWVVTSEDVDKYIEYLDTERPDAVPARDWFPPYFVYETIKKNGKKGVSMLPSKWYNDYDPMWSEQMEEKTITENEIQEEEIITELDRPMYILTKDFLKSDTWKQFFVDGMDEGKSLTSDGINNWEEVVNNIKDPKLKQRAMDTNTLYGDEYPDATYIVEGVMKVTHEDMEELFNSDEFKGRILWNASPVKGEKR